MKPHLNLAEGEGSLFIYLAVNLHQIFELYKIVPFTCLGLQNIEQYFKLSEQVNNGQKYIPLWIINSQTSEYSVDPNIREFIFPNSSQTLQGCLILAWSPHGSAIICVQKTEKYQSDEANDNETLFDFCWSFDQRLIELIIDNFANIINLQNPELAEEFRMNRAFVENARIYSDQQEKLQDELQQLENQLEEIFTSVDNSVPITEIAPLMATKMLTHDLRSQIQNLVMALDMIATDHFDQQQKASFLSAARQSANQLLELVHELYNVTSHQEESFPVIWEELVLQDVTQSMINTLLPTQSYSDISIVSTLPKTLPTIWGDKHLIMRIFQNIIFNAVRFTPPQGMITIGLVHPLYPQQIAISITNNGSQISDAAIEQIEERIRDPQSMIRARSGIGLVFCKQAMQAMQGHFKIEPFGSNGTRVTLSFRTVKPEA